MHADDQPDSNLAEDSVSKTDFNIIVIFSRLNNSIYSNFCKFIYAFKRYVYINFTTCVLTWLQDASAALIHSVDSMSMACSVSICSSVIACASASAPLRDNCDILCKHQSLRAFRRKFRRNSIFCLDSKSLYINIQYIERESWRLFLNPYFRQ